MYEHVKCRGCWHPLVLWDDGAETICPECGRNASADAVASVHEEEPRNVAADIVSMVEKLEHATDEEAEALADEILRLEGVL